MQRLGGGAWGEQWGLALGGPGMVMYWNKQEQASARDCMYIITQLAPFSFASDYQLGRAEQLGAALGGHIGTSCLSYWWLKNCSAALTMEENLWPENQG